MPSVVKHGSNLVDPERECRTQHPREKAQTHQGSSGVGMGQGKIDMVKARLLEPKDFDGTPFHLAKRA